MQSLPPLPWLRSFVAVVEHGRFARAAEALELTDSAISHHLRRLETFLGVRLVERTASGCRPTREGEALYACARQALDLLEAGVRDVTGAGKGKIALTLPRALATHWLVPRFPRLYMNENAPELHLVPTTRLCDLERERIDLGIRLGAGEWPGLASQPLLPQRIAPVTAPGLAEECRSLGWARTLAERTLIVNAKHPDEWTDWCRATGYAAPGDRMMRLESFDLVLQAALAGSGLVMGRTPMIEDALARGDLVAPFPGWVDTPDGYYVVWPRHRPPTRHGQVVMDWLVDSARG